MGLNSELCIRGFRTFCSLFIGVLLSPTWLSGENLLIAISLMATVGLVSFDSCDSFIPACGCWFLVFCFIRDVVVDSKPLLSVFLYDGEGTLTFYFLVNL